MSKLNVWIIDKDDDIMIKQLRDLLEEEKLDKKVKIRHIKKFIVECMEIDGSPDIIFIDTTSIQGEIPTIYGCWDTLYSNLKYFVRKHTSSLIVIASYVKNWAEDYLEQLTEDLKDEVTCIYCENGSRGILEVIKKYVK